MSQVFLDTSAILALLNPRDEHYLRGRSAFARLRGTQAGLITTSFVLVETNALLARRLGLAAVWAFRGERATLCDVVWVDASTHEEGLDLLLERGKKDLSLVDAVSFLVMRRNRVDEAFAFDPHFKDEGFSPVA